MKTRLGLLLCLVAILSGCGGGPTAPGEPAPPPLVNTPRPTVTPRPTPSDGLPCRPYPKCLTAG